MVFFSSPYLRVLSLNRHIVVIAGVFVIMERTGAANEDPFENKVTDVPMTYICNTLERDLLEMLGEIGLPEKLEPVKGYLI